MSLKWAPDLFAPVGGLPPAPRHFVVIRAWLWPGAKTDNPDKKPHCLWQVLELDPDNTTALSTMTVLRSEKGKH